MKQEVWHLDLLTLKQLFLLIEAFCPLLLILIDNFPLKELAPKHTLLLYPSNVFAIFTNYLHQSPVDSPVPFCLLPMLPSLPDRPFHLNNIFCSYVKILNLLLNFSFLQSASFL